MNFQQLRIIRETLRQDFNLTEVANALYTSQPGVSKHIKDLEDELGIEIFVRRGKRLLGLTEPGKEPRWSLQNPPLVATQTPPGRIVEIVMQSIAAGRFFCRPLLVNEEPVTA